MITVSYEKLFLTPAAQRRPLRSQLQPLASAGDLWAAPSDPASHLERIDHRWGAYGEMFTTIGVIWDFEGYAWILMDILWDVWRFYGISMDRVLWMFHGIYLLHWVLRLVFDGFCLSIRPRMGSRWRQLRRVLRPFPSFLREWRHHWADESAPDCGQPGWVQDKGRPADVEFVVWVPSAIQTCIK
jgi:hypothetical protein